VAGSEEIARKEEERERRRKALERQITELRERFETESAVLESEIQEASRRREQLAAERSAMAESRQAFVARNRAGKRPQKEQRP
jgi:cell division protein FtsB